MTDNFLERFRSPIIILLAGALLVSLGLIYYKSQGLFTPTKVEILEASGSGVVDKKELTVEIAGEVIKPGVYSFKEGSRIDDLLNASGGFSGEADRTWTDKYLNRAAKLTDGQKVYIPKVDEQTNKSSAKIGVVDQTTSGVVLGQSGGGVNINEASSSELDKLPGIGPVYAQKIIDHRPYSNTEELLSKGALTKSVYEKVKDLVTVY